MAAAKEKGCERSGGALGFSCHSSDALQDFFCLPQDSVDQSTSQIGSGSKRVIGLLLLDMGSTIVYRHSPLSREGNIRLLRLMPHESINAPLKCQLFEYPLSRIDHALHLYEALSYVWGCEDNRQSIYIQSDDKSASRRLLVTANLHDALLSIRDAHLERILWIDAICINQGDSDEKGHQVRSMAKTYSGASRVIVWLGAGSNAASGDQALFEALRKAAARDEIDPAALVQQISPLLSRPWFQRIWVCVGCLLNPTRGGKSLLTAQARSSKKWWQLAKS